jgi:hypothetical protein
VPSAEAGRLARVDREHPVARRDQGLHPQAAVGLDPDQHLVGLQVLAVHSDQGVQPRHPGHALVDPGSGQAATVMVLDLHIVVILGPVVAHKQHVYVSLDRSNPEGAACGRRAAA